MAQPQFTEAVQQVLERAFHSAQEHNHTEISENHLLLAFFDDPQGYFSTLAASLHLNPQTLIPALKDALKRVPTFSGSAQPPGLSSALQARIAEAQNVAK